MEQAKNATSYRDVWILNYILMILLSDLSKTMNILLTTNGLTGQPTYGITNEALM